MKLTAAEEELMNYLWDLKRAVMKDLLDAYEEPKPAATTVSTLLKRMQEKSFVGYDASGKSREYFPLVSKESYFARHLQGLIKNFFNDSPGQFASFFAKKVELSEAELQDLKSLIDEKLDQRS